MVGTQIMVVSNCSEMGVLQCGNFWNCDQCNELFRKSGTEIKKTINKWRGYQLIAGYIKKKSTFEPLEIEVLDRFTRTADKFLSQHGLQLKSSAIMLLQYAKSFQEFRNRRDKLGQSPIVDGCVSSNQALDPSRFLRDLSKLMNSNPEFRESIPFLMMQSIVAKFSGWENAPYPERLLNFYHLVASHSRVAQSIMSANMYGPSICHIKRLQSTSFNEPIILDCSENAICDRVLQFIKPIVDKGLGPVAVSVHFDGVAVPKTMQLSHSHKVVVGGMAPNHLRYIDEALLNENDPANFANFIRSEGILKAQEIKVVAMTCQQVPVGMPCTTAVAAWPQRKNAVSDINYIVYNTFMKLAHDHSDKIVFLIGAVDGLASES